MKIRSHRIMFVAALVLIALFFGITAVKAAQPATPKQQTLSAEKIRSAVRAFITRNAPWSTDQMTIQKIRFDRSLTLPAGRVSLQVTPPKHTDWLGAIPFSLVIAVNGEKTLRFTVAVNIQVWQDIILTAKPLGRFQPIERDDIQIKRMDLARAPSNALTQIDQVLGRRANRNIAANCILRNDQVEFPPIVKRGDLVQVVAQSSNLKISVKALAKQNGRKGDRIKVINVRSKKAIYALVVDDQTVQVEF